MVPSYSELYEEGEVDHINGPTHPPGVERRVRGIASWLGLAKKKKKNKKVEIKNIMNRKWKHVATQKANESMGFYTKLTTPMGVALMNMIKAVKLAILSRKSGQTPLI